MISFRDSFNVHYLEHIRKHRNICYNSNTKYTSNELFNSLVNQIQNKVYFSRKSLDKPIIDGKYLNNIHNKRVREKFYETFYSRALNEYIKETNGTTLSILSIDSTFICNVLGNLRGNNKNPQFYNKSGFKNVFLCDSLGVPISITQIDCTDYDSISIDKSLNNILIDKNTLDIKKK